MSAPKTSNQKGNKECLLPRYSADPYYDPYEELDRRFDYRVLDDETRALRIAVGRQFKNFARNLEAMLDDSREKNLALERLEEAMMWANASLARGAETS